MEDSVHMYVYLRTKANLVQVFLETPITLYVVLHINLRNNNGPENARKQEKYQLQELQACDYQKKNSIIKNIESDPVKCITMGLLNTGNSCFLNSCLQGLLGLPSFVTDMDNFLGAVQKLSLSIEDKVLLQTFMSFISLYP